MFNRVFLIGRLGGDPEIRYTVSGGTPVASFSLATNEVIVKEGKKTELTEWHRVVAFGKLAEHCGNYLQRGDMIFVEGKLRTRTFEDRNGVQRSITEVWAERIKFLQLKSREEGKEVQEVQESQKKDLKVDGSVSESISGEDPSEFLEEDLPF